MQQNNLTSPAKCYWEFNEKIGEQSVGEEFDWVIYRKHVLHILAFSLIMNIQRERGN